ncbi:MAG: sulfotransferase family protein [Candidatus Binatia bacterium]
MRTRGRQRGAAGRAVRRGLTALNRIVSPIESRLPRGGEAEISQPLLFVVGPPRSGTTLLSQLLIARFDVGYFTNLHGWFWGAPSWVERWLRPSRWPRVDTFRSDLGNTDGILGTSECAVFWFRFFPERPHCLPAGALGPDERARARAAVARLARAFGRPIVFKTVLNTARIQPLAEAFPEASFLVSRRNPVEIAHSVLEARQRTFGSYDRWWATEPPGWEHLERSPAHEQAIEQVLRMSERIERDRAAVGPDRFFDVSYAEVCENARGVLHELRKSLAGRGIRLTVRAEVPAAFPRREGLRIPRELYRDLLLAYEERSATGLHRLGGRVTALAPGVESDGVGGS